MLICGSVGLGDLVDAQGGIGDEVGFVVGEDVVHEWVVMLGGVTVFDKGEERSERRRLLGGLCGRWGIRGGWGNFCCVGLVGGFVLEGGSA